MEVPKRPPATGGPASPAPLARRFSLTATEATERSQQEVRWGFSEDHLHVLARAQRDRLGVPPAYLSPGWPEFLLTRPVICLAVLQEERWPVGAAQLV